MRLYNNNVEYYRYCGIDLVLSEKIGRSSISNSTGQRPVKSGVFPLYALKGHQHQSAITLTG